MMTNSERHRNIKSLNKLKELLDENHHQLFNEIEILHNQLIEKNKEMIIDNSSKGFFIF